MSSIRYVLDCLLIFLCLVLTFIGFIAIHFDDPKNGTVCFVAAILGLSWAQEFRR